MIDLVPDLAVWFVGEHGIEERSDTVEVEIISVDERVKFR